MHRLPLFSKPLLCLLLTVFIGACGDDEGVSTRPTATSTGSSGTSDTTQTGTTASTTSTAGTTGTTGTTGTGTSQTGACEPSGEEVCDGVDNDCNGEVDEGYDLGSVERCGSCDNACAFDNAQAACNAGSCAIAACDEGFEDLDGDPSNGCEEPICVPTGAGDELCDERDNDCDGEIDEDFGVGVSQDHCLGCNSPCDLPNAEASCNAGACDLVRCEDGYEDADGDPSNGCEVAPCEPSGEEVCDGVDNDCNGEVDEGYDLGSVERCGSCDNACVFDNAQAACNAGSCAIAACDEGFEDLDGDPSNGCEYACNPTNPSSEDIACDGEDNDCDGEIDEGSVDGSQCQIADGVFGTLQCADGAAQCVSNPSGGEDRLLCGAVSGVLTEDGGPYVVSCDEIFVEAGETLTVQPGTLITADSPDTARVTVRGSLRGSGHRWNDLHVVVEGSAELDDVSFFGNANLDTIFTVQSDAQTSVVLRRPLFSQISPDGDRVGLRVAGVLEEGSLVLDSPRFGSCAVGLAFDARGTLSLSDAVWSGNRSGVVVDLNDGETRSLLLEGGRVEFSSFAPNATLIDVQGDGSPVDSLSVQIQDVEFDMSDGGSLATVDPDRVGVLSVGGLALENADWAAVRLVGDVDRGTATLDDWSEPTVRTVLGGEMEVASGSTLSVNGTLYGDSADTTPRVSVSGSLLSNGGRFVDVALFGEADGASFALEDAVVEATQELRDVCLMELSGDSAQTFSVAQTVFLGHEEVDGLCITDLRGGVEWDGARFEGLREGLVLRGSLGEGTPMIQGVEFVDVSRALVLHTDRVPIVRDNVFRSSLDRRSILVTFRVGSEPGGQVLNNIYDVDITDVSYDLDPDTMSDLEGTIFGPNQWPNAHPGIAFLSGTQTSPNVRLYNVTELDLGVSPFWDLQVIEDIVVSSGSTMIIDPNADDVVTFYGPAATPNQGVLQVEGQLDLRGPNVIFSNLPIRFAPQSTGTMTLCTLISSRSDLAMVEIEDAAPRIGGQIATKCTLTGAQAANHVGVRIRASSAMCTGELNDVCPFIAENDFRDLGIGVEIFTPAAFRGVNNFDDANPQGDSVPINTITR